MDRLRRLGSWFDERLHLTQLYEGSAGHRIPSRSASWWYVFGSGTLVCFVLQIITGICLALVYVPSPNEAYASLEYLNYQQTLGWFLRGVHNWGSVWMVGLLTIHVIQVFLFGAYKYPRELTWVIGCVLFLCTLGAAFTGQIMRFDQDAYWGLQIGISIMGRIPFIGADLVHLVQGGPIIGSETLSRFFSVHVFVLPGLGGLAISEAMAHGLPVVATEADGCEVDLVEEGANGYLLPVGDRDALEARLDEMLSDPQRLERMSAHSRQVIERRYNINTYMQNVVAAVKYAHTGRREADPDPEA